MEDGNQAFLVRGEGQWKKKNSGRTKISCSQFSSPLAYASAGLRDNNVAAFRQEQELSRPLLCTWHFHI